MRLLFDNEIEQVSGGTNYIDLNPGSVITVTSSGIGGNFSSFSFSGIPFGSMQSAINVNFLGNISNFFNNSPYDDPEIVVTGYKDVSNDLTPGQVAAILGLGAALIVVTGGIGGAVIAAAGADGLTLAAAAAITTAASTAVGAAAGAIGAASGGGGGNNHGGGPIYPP